MIKDNMAEFSDEEIASRVQKGDTESFGVLIERYEQKIRRYARKFLYDKEDVKDAVQNVFIKAYANIRSFDRKKKFSPWIYRIAHNEFINAIKKRGKEKYSFLSFDILLPYVASKETADRDANRAGLKQMLDQCLDKIGPKYREPLVLYYYEELNYREISEILRIPLSTVGVRLQRGKKILKKLIENFEKKNGRTDKQ